MHQLCSHNQSVKQQAAVLTMMAVITRTLTVAIVALVRFGHHLDVIQERTMLLVWPMEGTTIVVIPRFNPNLSRISTILTKATTKDECLSRGQVCVEPQISGSLSSDRSPRMPPRGITLKDATQCSACHGERTSFYTWTPVSITVVRIYSCFNLTL